MQQRIFIIYNLLFISLIYSSRLKYRASVKENVDLYYTIISLDKMLPVNYQQTIEFLNTNSPYTTYFLVDGQKLRTSRLIDREEFCRIKLCENFQCNPCEISMDFVLKENNQVRDIISLILTIEDINEYRPEFFNTILYLNISEGVPVGHVLPIPSATDKDGEENELSYFINKTQKIPFELISFGSNQIALNVTEPLDRETENFYQLQLIVYDRANLTTTLPIHISISDINDNVPIFDQQTPYIINISENLLPSLNKPLLRIHAIDNDTQDNSRIAYNFSPQVSELIRQTFYLNSQTGELYLIHTLDYEQYKEYRLAITAQDSGPVSVPVYTTVIIHIDDENDNKPLMNIRISEYFQFLNNSLYISEETPLNTLLMHILVEDFDSDLNGKINCSIETTDHLKLNITNTINNMFSIYTSQLFDRELTSKYKFRLIVEDSGLKIRHQTTRDLQLIITDINDSAPKFTQLVYNLSIQEEEKYEKSLIKFHATDADANENSQISYQLMTNEYRNVFDLNNQTGDLYLLEKLDRETKSEYNLTIRAYDHGIYPSQLYTDTYCYIKVLNKNEYKPKFDKEKYLFDQINETISINSSIGFIKASDLDQDQIFYSILSTTKNYRINSFTGELFVNQQLDYDTKNTCESFLGLAKDEQGLNSTCQIEICLQPINEYAPELSSQSRFISINIDNTSLIHINAFDRDYSPSTYLSYQFEQTSKCNLTYFRNGTISINPQQPCLGIIDLFVSINDNDPTPLSKITNETIRLIFYSNNRTLQQILSPFNYKFTIEIIIISIILILILMICSLVLYIIYRQRKHKQLNQTKVHFPENHSLLNDAILDTPKPTSTSDTSSSYNDSCYGSSEMDVYHHQHQHQFNGKILLSSNDKYIILCKDQNNIINDEINSSSSSSPSSASPTGTNNGQLMTKYQVDKRKQQYQTKFFQNNNEYRRVTGTTTTFNYRNITPLNEYYL